MAIQVWTINVEFTANQVGEHRVCWRLVGATSYDCSTLVVCAGGATQCDVDIITSVNGTSCDGPAMIEGYIQPTCEDILSSSNRLAWGTSFSPSPTCLRQEVSCIRGTIGTAVVDSAGSGYTPGDTITITRDGADTEVSNGVVDIATVGTGVINTISSLISGGTGYTAADVLTIVGSAGSGGTITVDTIGGGGTIATYTLTTGGTLYIGPFTFTGGTGSGADFEIVSGGVDYDDSGSILTLTITTPGLYGVIPTLSVAGPGVGGDVSVLLTQCSGFSVGTDCDSNSVTVNGLDVGATYATCIVGAVGATPADFNVITTGCCIAADSATNSCYSYTFYNSSGGAIVVQYTACDGVESTASAPAGGNVTVCAVLDGWLNPNLTSISVVQGSFCS